MHTITKKAAAFAGLALVATLALSGCGPDSKANEQFQDAKVSGHNYTPAQIGTMPDGFGNWATKCDHGNRVYTLFHGDSSYGGISVVAGDPSCAVK